MGDFAKNMSFAALITALLFGGLGLYARHRRAEHLANGRGEVKALVLGSAEGRALWVSVETQEFSSEDDDETVWRLSVYDAATGARLARKAEVPWRACAAATAGLLWCAVGDAVEVVRLPSLEVLHASAEVQARVGQKLMQAASLVVMPAGALRSLLADGRVVELAADSLAVSPAGPPPQAAPGPSLGLRPCTLPNTGREGLCREAGGARADSGEGFLRPRLLAVEGLSDRVLVLNQTSLDDAVAATQLSVLDAELKPVSLRVLTPREPLLLRTHWLPATRTVVLGFGAPAHVTVAVDVDTGAERYRIEH